MLDSWLNITNGGNETIKRDSNPPTNPNTPTYNQPQVNQGGVNNNDNGDFNWYSEFKNKLLWDKNNF